MSDIQSSSRLTTAVAKSTVLQQSTPNHNPLAAFSLLPYGSRFDVQHADELILLILRQHPIVNVGWILLTIVLAILPLLLLRIFPIFFLLPLTFQIVLILTWYLITLGFAFEQFVMWYYNIYIVTDERVIDIDFFSLLFKRVSETKLDNIEDITAASGGVVQSLFDYGDVFIQTAAEVPELTFERVPKPDLVTKLISELIDKERIEDTGKK